jgi:hypothetical protein
VLIDSGGQSELELVLASLGVAACRDLRVVACHLCVCASSTGRRCSTKTWYLMQSASIRTLYSARSLDQILAIGSNLEIPFSQPTLSSRIMASTYSFRNPSTYHLLRYHYVSQYTTSIN